MENRLDPLEDIVGDLFVDRHEELDLFWEWATSIPYRLGNSFALIGRRRTGKTAILVKLFNRLYHEQERVLPVFITLARYLHRRKPIDSYEFAQEYFGGYVASYLAFRYRQPELLSQQPPDLARLRDFARQVQDEYALDLYDQYDGLLTGDFSTAPYAGAYAIMQWAINFPRGAARVRNMPTAIIIDEFQVLTNVYNPQSDRYNDLTDSFQWAVDTRWAPLLVSGSAVSLLVGEALGGMLSGRFNYWYLRPLAHEYAHDLVFRLSEFAGVTVTEELAETIWQLTAGYPYSIYGLMTSFCPARRRFPSVDALEEVLTFELSNTRGKLWQHYNEEFEKYSQQLNEEKITRRVMLWATKYPDQRIDAEHVAQEIGVEVAEVRAALEKLRWADVVEKVGLISYKGPSDPMLRRFIEYQHYTEIEKLAPAEVVKDWQKEYQRLRGQVSNFIGGVAEGYSYAVMSAFDGREVAGEDYFNHPELVTLPAFEKIERRSGIIKTGVPFEIDLTGEAGVAAWLVQVKYTQSPVGSDEVRRFLKQTETVIAERGYTTVTRWYFCKRGFTAEAAQALQRAGVLHSDRAQFNALANLFGFFGLPE